MIRIIKNLVRAELAKPLTEQKIISVLPNRVYSFGKKNRKKFFYVIKRKFNANGMFSNLRFVIDHIIYAKKKNYIPIVDMKNFPTVYNEKKKINNKSNSWNYYFKSINFYNLKEIYKSKNVIFSSNITLRKFEIDQDLYSQKIFNKYIKINEKILKKYKILKKKNF